MAVIHDERCSPATKQNGIRKPLNYNSHSALTYLNTSVFHLSIIHPDFLQKWHL